MSEPEVTSESLMMGGGGLAGLELRARQIVDGFLAGRHRGPRRGSSAEFAEHREYAAGDDLRYLDWKVYGKHDRYYLKQLEQETNFTCSLLLDVSPSMRFRSEHAPLSKLEFACVAASALAWLVLRQQDLVAVATLGEKAVTVAQPSGQPAQLRQIAGSLERVCGRAHEQEALDAPQSEARQTVGCVHEWAETCQNRGVVVVLSDCFGDPESVLSSLRHLRSRRHDVILLHVIDPAEQDFPFDEPTRFHDLESSGSQPADCRRIRAAYCAEFERFLRRLETDSRECGVDYALLRTDAPVERGLAAFLSHRKMRGR